MKNIIGRKVASITVLFILTFAVSCVDRTSSNGQEETNSDTTSYIMYEDQPLLMKDVHGERWKDDPEEGIQVRVVKDSGTVHEQVMKGTVTRGTYVIDTLDRRRQFIYTVYHPDRDSGCTEYGWYSWVNPAIELENTNGTFSPASFSGTHQAATGNPFRFGKWNKDCQKKWVDSMNEVRRRNGSGPFPILSSGDSLKDGQPYMPFPTPDGDGFLDCPSYTARGEHGEQSIAERIFRKIANLKDEKEELNQPSSFTRRIRFTTRGITYLYCLRQVACLGWFRWTSVETVFINVQWVEKGIAAGMTKKWKSGITFNSTSTVTMEPWQNCR